MPNKLESSRIYSPEEMKVMKMHATGNAAKPYTDHYKEGSYDSLLPDIISQMPKINEDRVSLISFGSHYLNHNEVVYMNQLIGTKELNPDGFIHSGTTIGNILKGTNLEIKPTTRWKRFKIWFKAILRLK